MRHSKKRQGQGALIFRNEAYLAVHGNDLKMKRNAEVGLFAKPSIMTRNKKGKMIPWMSAFHQMDRGF